MAIKQLALEDLRPRNTRLQASRAWPADSSEEKEGEEAFLISFSENIKRNCRPQPSCEINIKGSTVTTLIDTGASVNIMGLQQYQPLWQRPLLVNSKTRIFTYGSVTLLLLKGKMPVKVKVGCREIQATFHIIAREADILISSHLA
ncbi:hypothetical protein NDU88_002158 [Pleurodeles waltl]|uniref:Peptidase A2 domain-containing protein n=1 Tax=Pleurodeles waltl TaxID=8319 RepID=A0AAV7TL64_PLEWA|nr:hypothetical protein NDU88_002158 [Pleurodeles waltl]